MFGDLRQRFGLHPFGEVVDRDNYKLSLARCRRERIEYIDPLLGEGPWGDNSSQLAGGAVLQIGMLLTRLAPPNQVSRIFLHGGSIVSLS